MPKGLPPLIPRLEKVLAMASPHAPLVSVAVEVTPVSIYRIIKHLPLPRVVWVPPLAHRTAAHQWSAVGFGEAARIVGTGPQRFSVVRDEAAAIFARLDHPGRAHLPGPGIRFFGGGAFSTTSDKSWQTAGFPDALFILPAYEYVTNGQRAFWRVTLSQQVIADGSWRTFVRDIPAEPLTGQIFTLPAGHVTHRLADWVKRVSTGLSAVAEGQLEKVVVARVTEARFERPLPWTYVLERMARAQADCVRFSFAPDKAVFMGATPEQLVSVQHRGSLLAADAMAGSMGWCHEAEADDAAVRLLSSDKDRREFEFVRRDLVERLEALNLKVEAPATPSIRTLKNVHHLHSQIIGTPATPLHVLDAVVALHPTPAVCGTPRAAAAKWLAANEGLARGWYAGPLGWFNREGDGDFAVAIRSALVTGQTATLYAGSGLVAGSTESGELHETSLKLAAMMEAMGIS